jgi:hypothetical protein
MSSTLNRDLSINKKTSSTKFLDARYFTDYTSGKKTQTQTQTQTQIPPIQNNMHEHLPNRTIPNQQPQNEKFTDSWMKYDKNKIKVHEIKGQPQYSFDNEHNDLSTAWLRGGEPTKMNENYFRKEFGKNTRIHG